MPYEVTSPALLLTAWQLSCSPFCSSAGARSPLTHRAPPDPHQPGKGFGGETTPLSPARNWHRRADLLQKLLPAVLPTCWENKHFHLPPAAPALGRTFWVDFTLQSQQPTLTRVGRAHQLCGAHTGAFEAASVWSRNAPRHGWCWCCSLEGQPWFCELAAMQKALRHCTLL